MKLNFKVAFPKEKKLPSFTKGGPFQGRLRETGPWFKRMRTRYGKLTSKKSGDGAREYTDRDSWILRSFSFLDDHIS